MEDINPLNFAVTSFTDKLIHVYLLIDPFKSERFYPSTQYTKFNTLNSYMEIILDFMASCHLAEPGCIIASLHVSLVYLCSPTNLCPQIIYLITKSTRHRGSIGTSISMTTTLCRHVNHEHCSHLRNTFCRCATLIILL